MHRFIERPLPALAFLSISVCAAPLLAQDVAQWSAYSANEHATRYSPLAQIDASNVANLRVAWRHPHVDPQILAANPDLTVSNRYMATPIIVDGVLYVPNGFGLVEAIDPASGRTLWTQRPLIEGVEGLPSLMISKGVTHWGSGVDARILTVRQQHLFALNPRTGEPIASFGDGGKVALSTEEFRYKWAGVPVVAGDVVILGASMLEQDSAVYKDGPPGEVRAFDVRTGEPRWMWQAIPQAGDPATATWQDDAWQYSGAANVWSTFSVDEELGYVYVPTSGATNDMYGGHRLGDNLYTSSIVCLDAKTGRRVWHFQTVHHDLFDYDLPAAPILIDITVDGRKIKALAQVTKQGFVFVLDRVTGAPVWPIEERPVPASTVPGEVASPTQPFPTKPPPFEHQGLTVDDLTDFTPELRAEALEIVKRYRLGPQFTPPSAIDPSPNGVLGTIQVAGASGGASWHGAAFDPDTGMLYVPSRSVAFVADLFAPDPARSDLRYRAGMREIKNGPRGLPLIKPPYGRITAYDLNRGEQAWMVANGDGPRNHPALAGLNLPPLGEAVPSAAIATKTLLFVTEGDRGTPRTPANAGGTRFKALDKATGAVLWEIDLGAGANGTPMTYLHAGKQYVVVAIGGTEHRAELVALALPGTGDLALLSPVTAGALDRIEKYLLTESPLDPKLTALLPLITAREMNLPYEWSVREDAALESGLEPAVIEVVRRNGPVTGLTGDNALLLDFGRQLFRNRHVDSNTFAALVERLGRRGAFDAIMLLAEPAMTGVLQRAVDQAPPAGWNPERLPPVSGVGTPNGRPGEFVDLTDRPPLPSDVHEDSYYRLPLLKRQELDARGREIFDRVVGADHDTAPRGPVGMTFQSPELVEPVQAINGALRENGALDTRTAEIVIAATGREMNSQYQWNVHGTAAERAGAGRKVLDAIRDDGDISGLDARDAVAIALTREIFREGKVRPATFAAAVDLFGTRGTVEMAALVGDYLMITTVYNALGMRLRADQATTLPHRAGAPVGAEWR